MTRAARPRLAVGVAGGYNFRTLRSLSTHSTAFTAGTTNYTHLAADVVFKYRGFSLLAEVPVAQGLSGRDRERDQWHRHPRVRRAQATATSCRAA